MKSSLVDCKSGYGLPFGGTKYVTVGVNKLVAIGVNKLAYFGEQDGNVLSLVGYYKIVAVGVYEFGSVGINKHTIVVEPN
jgi:hypothetical protein